MHRGLPPLLAIVLSGCAGLSGLNGASSFQCSAPAGIPCQSVTGVHLNERAGNLPSQRPQPRQPKTAAPTEMRTGEGYPPNSIPPATPSTHSTSQRSGSPAGSEPDLAAGTKIPALETRPMLGAIRSDPTVIRIWIAPWEDGDGDLNDQGYVYLQIDSGRWLIEHNRERIRREFTPGQAATASRRPAGSTVAATKVTGTAGGASAGADGARAEPSQDVLAAITEGRRRAQLAGGDSGAPASAPVTGTRP